MHKITDDELISELQRKCQENKETLHELRTMTRKLEQLNARLQESEALKSHFLSNIRNEINNPLTAIMGHCVYLLSLNDVTKDTLKSVATTIHSEAMNLDFQLRNIFAAAELEAGEAYPSISKVEIHCLINNLLTIFDPKIQEKQLRVNLHNKINVDTFFKTDAQKLHLILSNLIANSIEYSYTGNQIAINAWIEEKQLHISVEDHGVGIEKSDEKTIFDRFKQISSGTMKEHRGHGLGLSVAKSLLELLNGKISVSSKVGLGSIFTIVVPEADDIETEEVAINGNEFIFDEQL